jgi:hypothetical protein
VKDHGAQPPQRFSGSLDPDQAHNLKWSLWTLYLLGSRPWFFAVWVVVSPFWGFWRADRFGLVIWYPVCTRLFNTHTLSLLWHPWAHEGPREGPWRVLITKCKPCSSDLVTRYSRGLCAVASLRHVFRPPRKFVYIGLQQNFVKCFDDLLPSCQKTKKPYKKHLASECLRSIRISPCSMHIYCTFRVPSSCPDAQNPPFLFFR